VSERLPAPDLAAIKAAVPRLRGKGKEVLVLKPGDKFVRVHRVAGTRLAAWNQFGYWGPTKSRFDHHLPSPSDRERGILYAARASTSFTAAIAEHFGDDSGAGVGPIDPLLHSPTMTLFTITEEIPLLDLDSGWVTRAGGHQAIKTGPRDAARAWARAIYDFHRDKVLGLAYGSSVWGPGRCIALWETARDILPSDPNWSRLMSDPALGSAIAKAAEELETVIAQ
jgi:hypothetical protein